MVANKTLHWKERKERGSNTKNFDIGKENYGHFLLVTPTLNFLTPALGVAVHKSNGNAI